MNAKAWDRLCAEAQRVVAATIAELPIEIRSEAAQVPCLFERYCDEDPEILGLYGHFTPGTLSEANGPIILYLLAIEEYCLDEDADFAAEVRTTFLHELGHHFGWDEDDLEIRGLS
jgi:predicted Zn-dependent protease with MMP-like domain